MGFTSGINVLPYFYENQQRHLLNVLAKALPDFFLTVVLFNADKKGWRLI